MTNDKIIESSQIFDHKDITNIKENGVVFTPKHICDKMIRNLSPDITDKICEPSVGKGIFVFSLLEYFLENNDIEAVAEFTENRLYCFDINAEFINELKVSLKTYFSNKGYIKELNFNNIKTADFLFEYNIKYDVIIGNPPYVKIHNIDKDKLENLKYNYASLSSGNIDLYYAFIEKSVKSSKRFSLIVPNAFIKNKSGKIIRDMLYDRISEIWDFKTDKIWSDISTYTCIITVDELKTESIKYNDNSFVKIQNNDKWIFEISDNKENSLSSLINYSSIGIQTSADKYFIIKKFDDKYGYINGHKIELSSCKKVLKATKTRNLSEYNYVYYPYFPDNSIMEEDYIKSNFPLLYEYLISIKDVLEARNLNHDKWYAYGRSQGLLRKSTGTNIILPNTFLKSRNIHYIEIPDNEEYLVLNGILVDTNDSEKLIDIITSDDFLSYLENTNKTLPDKQGSGDVWLFLTSNSLKNYFY